MRRGALFLLLGGFSVVVAVLWTRVSHRHVSPPAATSSDRTSAPTPLAQGAEQQATRTDAALPPASPATQAGPAPTVRVRLAAQPQVMLPPTWSLRVQPLAHHWRDHDPAAAIWAAENSAEDEGLTADAGGDGGEDADAGADPVANDDPTPDPEDTPPWSVAGAGQSGEFPLAFGRYRLTAEAAYARSMPVDIHLSKDTPHAEVTLQLHSLAVVVGRASNPSATCAGLGVFLEERTSGVIHTTTVDSSGQYRFEGVALGSAFVGFGRRQRPLIKRTQIEVIAPITELPDRALPPMRTVSARVIDVDGNPIAGARVRLTAVDGGEAAGVSGPDGFVAIPFVPLGNTRAFAMLRTVGRANLLTSITADASADPVQLMLRQ